MIAAAPVALPVAASRRRRRVGPPAHLVAVTDLNRTAVVGATIPGGLGRHRSPTRRAIPSTGASVAFAVTGGNGSTNPRIATTGANGQATAAWTFGTIAGDNVITASVSGVTTKRDLSRDGHARDPRRRCRCRPRACALPVNVDSARISAASLDSFGNATTPTPVLVAARSDADQPRRHGTRSRAATRIVDVGRRDVRRQDRTAFSSPCWRSANRSARARRLPVDLAVGQVVTDVSGDGFCVHARARHRVRDRPVLQLRRGQRRDDPRGARPGDRAAVASDRPTCSARRPRAA